MSKSYRVGILGATGMVGQRFITLLSEHPWFTITALAASASSAGKTYEEAVTGRWKMDAPIPVSVRDMQVYDVKDIAALQDNVDFVFSAVNMSKEEIKVIEEQYAKAEIPVVSNNSAHRWTPDVPMLIPEINASHVHIIPEQKKRLGTEHGFIAVKPNCSIQCYVPALYAWMKYRPKKVLVSTYQAISGAGKTFDDWPEMRGNLIPYIAGEEEKSEQEPLRIFGTISHGEIIPSSDMQITSQCLRVPILNGHTASCFIDFDTKVTKEELIDALRTLESLPAKRHLPSAPNPFIQYLDDDDRPQITKDVDFGNGMGVSFGRLREDLLFDYKFIGMAHNTVRGAAGGAVLCAELLCDAGYICTKD